EAQVVSKRDGEIGADGEEAGMGEIDKAAKSEDQGEAERNEEVVYAVEQAVQHLLHQQGRRHGAMLRLDRAGLRRRRCLAAPRGVTARASGRKCAALTRPSCKRSPRPWLQ